MNKIEYLFVLNMYFTNSNDNLSFQVYLNPNTAQNRYALHLNCNLQQQWISNYKIFLQNLYLWKHHKSFRKTLYTPTGYLLYFSPYFYTLEIGVQNNEKYS